MTDIKKEKAWIAMSGGVDSAVAAYLTLSEGFSAEGVTMRLWSETESLTDTADPTPDQNCLDAAAVCAAMGIPHRSVGLGESFQKNVVDRFIDAYVRGLTPNPCVDCNRCLKFGRLLSLIDEWGGGLLITGHYAIIEKNEDGFYCLKKAKDSAKDQSYFLWGIAKEALPRIRFPLGEYTKPEIRAIALERGLPSASRSDSQDICFVPDGDYVRFIEAHSDLSFPKGNFVSPDGRVLGEHQGLIRYTVGQRKGLGIALGAPAFVSRKDPLENTVTLCSDAQLYTRELTASHINILTENGRFPARAEAKIRYRHTPAPATITHLDDGRIRVVFDSPQRAIAPGQSVVLYDGDTVLGGGVIEG